MLTLTLTITLTLTLIEGVEPRVAGLEAWEAQS